MNEVHSPKKPLIFYYMVAMLLVMLFNFIAMPWLSQYQIQEVDYNTFVSMTERVRSAGRRFRRPTTGSCSPARMKKPSTRPL